MDYLDCSPEGVGIGGDRDLGGSIGKGGGVFKVGGNRTIEARNALI